MTSKENFENWCIKETIAKIMFIAGLPLAILFAMLYKIFNSTPLLILLITFMLIGCFGGIWLGALYDK